MEVNYPNIFLNVNREVNRFQEGLVFHPRLREGAGLAVDAGSFSGNSLSALNCLTPVPGVGALVNTLALGRGFLGMGNGSCWARDAGKRSWAALSCGDLEGAVHHGLAGVAGSSYAGISGLLSAEGLMGLANVAVPAEMGMAVPAIGFAMYGALALHSAHGFAKAYSFGKELENRQQKGDLKVLKWLNRQINLDANDLWEIQYTAEDQEKEIATRLKKKWGEFERKTSPECAKMVREKLPGLLEKFDQKEARVLIQEVEKANFKQKVKHALLIAISLLGIAAFVAMMVLSGPAAPVLFALGALLWLTVDSSDLHNYIGEKCWNWHLGNQEPCLTPLKS